MRTQACLECLAEVRSRVEVPLIPMTYASILEAYGYERFATDAEAAGATSLIVADLPIEAAPELRRVQLVAPTTPDERIRLAAERTDGWLYPRLPHRNDRGARREFRPSSAGSSSVPAVTEVPLLAGFGIATPEQAAEAASLADGIVVEPRAIGLPTRAGLRRCAGTSASLRGPWTPRRRLSPSRL